MPSSTLLIRRATAHDVDSLADLGARTFRDAFGSANDPEDMVRYLATAFSPEQIAAELADPATIFLLAYQANTFIGYTRLYRGAAAACVQGPKPMELVRIYVAQEAIGQGHGASLMRASLEAAEQQGAETLWLGVWEQNERAIRFYEHWGFQPVGTHPFTLGRDLQTDLIMERAVSLHEPL